MYKEAVSYQLKRKTKVKTKNSLLLKFPAYGVFLLKRPKGTKSRRWARGLPNAWREYPHWMHRVLLPANLENNPSLGAVRNNAPRSGSSRERLRAR